MVIWLLINIVTVFLYCVCCVVREELTDIESLQFDLATVEAATDCFADVNNIGQGGFGVVYKVRKETCFFAKC